MNEGRFERQVRFLGSEGQSRLASTSVAIIGVGGLGSHLVQQLAFLGVGSVSVVDPDVVTESNLNRLIGAVHDDPSSNTPKADVAVRLAHGIDPGIEIIGISKNLISNEGFEAVKRADVVFGCVDNDGPRLVLTELCAAYRRPYFDLASEVIQDSRLQYGGRICFSDLGQACLYCLDEISTEETQRYFLSKDAKLDIDRLYGVPAGELQGSGPSVVTINGVVASLAATEFMVHATGLRKPARFLTYRGAESKVTVRMDEPQTDCFYCKFVYGLGRKANVERYLGGN